MSTHYTANRRRVYWSPFFLDFLFPLLWLTAVLNMRWDGRPIPLLFEAFGLLFVFYRIGRRIFRHTDPLQLYMSSCACLWTFYSFRLGGDDSLRISVFILIALCITIAALRGHALRLRRIESPASQARSAEFPGIYCITCRANGKQYIGQTSRPIHSRWHDHRADLNANRHHNRWLQADWNLYRPEQFTFSVLEVVTDPVWLLDRERYWQDKDYDAAKRYNPPNIPAITSQRRLAMRRKSK